MEDKGMNLLLPVTPWLPPLVEVESPQPPPNFT